MFVYNVKTSIDEDEDEENNSSLFKKIKKGRFVPIRQFSIVDSVDYELLQNFDYKTKFPEQDVLELPVE